jgi:hypothetical protein
MIQSVRKITKVVSLVTAFSLLAILIQVACNLTRHQHNTDENTISCELLLMSFQDELFQREFFLCSIASDSILLFDLNNQIIECDTQIEVCHKKVQIIETQTTDHRFVAGIILYRADFSTQTIRMYFWRPYSGAVVILYFKKIENRLSIYAREVGSF